MKPISNRNNKFLLQSVYFITQEGKVNNYPVILSCLLKKKMRRKYLLKSNLWFYVPFNSQGHIGTGPQALPLAGVEPTEVTACDKMPSLLIH